MPTPAAFSLRVILDPLPGAIKLGRKTRASAPCLGEAKQLFPAIKKYLSTSPHAKVIVNHKKPFGVSVICPEFDLRRRATLQDILYFILHLDRRRLGDISPCQPSIRARLQLAC